MRYYIRKKDVNKAQNFVLTPEEDLQDGTGSRAVFLRLIALVTVVSFLSLVYFSFWPALRLPLADLVIRTQDTRKYIDAALLQAVVKITVVARKKGSTLAVEERSGTGFNIDPGGVVVTNHHVVEGAINVTVTFPGGEMYAARDWNGNPETDLAVVRLKGGNLPVLPLGSDLPETGDRVMVAGNPLGLDNIVVKGKMGRYVRINDLSGSFFTIEAPIYPGHSGSPVFDAGGRVVGVVFASMRQKEDEKEKVTGLAVNIKELVEIR